MIKSVGTFNPVTEPQTITCERVLDDSPRGDWSSAVVKLFPITVKLNAAGKFEYIKVPAGENLPVSDLRSLVRLIHFGRAQGVSTKILSHRDMSKWINFATKSMLTLYFKHGGFLADDDAHAKEQMIELAMRKDSKIETTEGEKESMPLPKTTPFKVGDIVYCPANYSGTKYQHHSFAWAPGMDNMVGCFGIITCVRTGDGDTFYEIQVAYRDGQMYRWSVEPEWIAHSHVKQLGKGAKALLFHDPQINSPKHVGWLSSMERVNGKVVTITGTAEFAYTIAENPHFFDKALFIPMPISEQPKSDFDWTVTLDEAEEMAEAVQGSQDKEESPAASPAAPTDIAGAISALGGLLGRDVLAKVDSKIAEIEKRLFKKVENEFSRRVVVKYSGQPPKDTKIEGIVHKKFDFCLKVLSPSEAAEPQNLWLVGQAGSGKTTLGRQLAEAMGIKYYPVSCSMETSVYELFGYRDAGGNYIPGKLREPYENGGLLLIDELDAASPAVLVSLNSAIDNGHASFPDKVIERHPDFRCIGCANTYGIGGTYEYVGRNQIDGATLNRFVRVWIEYDERIEEYLAKGNQEWLDYVRRIRAACKEISPKAIISPRQVAQGAHLLAHGCRREDVELSVLFPGMDTDTIRRIKEKAGK